MRIRIFSFPVEFTDGNLIEESTADQYSQRALFGV